MRLITFPACWLLLAGLTNSVYADKNANGKLPSSSADLIGETCIKFDPHNLTIEPSYGGQMLKHGGENLALLGGTSCANKVKLTIAHYQANQACWFGPRYTDLTYYRKEAKSFDYLLKNGQPIAGNMTDDNCSSFEYERLTVTRSGGFWLAMADEQFVYRFRTKKQAENAVAIMKKHRFKEKCFVGGGERTVSHFRR